MSGAANPPLPPQSSQIQLVERAYRLGLIGEAELQRLRHYYTLPGQHLPAQQALGQFGVTPVGLALIEGDAQRLDPYRLTERLTKLDDKPLGEGGMGSIVRAHEGVLNRILAVKLIKNPRGNAMARFEREAKLMAKLRHKNCVSVIEAGLTRSGEPYYAMELIKGRSLGELIQQTPGGLEPAQVVSWCRDLAQALHACHALGIVHRDVKPPNIMIDQEGIPLLTDFGIAYHAETTAQLTQRGSLLGTLGYMPPEQLVGEGVDARADVYALGATLFHALTGRRLFDHDDARVVIASAMGSEPPALTDLRPDLPNSLGGLVQRCLAKKRDDRFSTAQELAQALDLVLQDLPEGWRYKTGSSSRPSQSPQTQPRGRAAVAFLVGLLLGGVGGAVALNAAQSKTAPTSSADTSRADPLAQELAQERENHAATLSKLAKLQTPAPPQPSAQGPATPKGLTWLREQEFRNDRDGSILIRIPPTEFTMGGGPEPNSPAVQRVSFTRAYFVGKFEVSVAQYRRFCQSTNRKLPPLELRGPRGGVYVARDGDPVFNVSYMDAQAYCAWATLRLPSEAEWELAARGRHGLLYPWGPRFFDGTVRANLGDESALRAGSINGPPIRGYDDRYPWVAPVNSFEAGASPYGCLHMIGNVQEWVGGRYGGAAAQSQLLRIVRASSWAFTGGFTTTKRFASAPTSVQPERGFRVARSE